MISYINLPQWSIFCYTQHLRKAGQLISFSGLVMPAYTGELHVPRIPSNLWNCICRAGKACLLSYVRLPLMLIQQACSSNQLGRFLSCDGGVYMMAKNGLMDMQPQWWDLVIPMTVCVCPSLPLTRNKCRRSRIHPGDVCLSTWAEINNERKSNLTQKPCLNPRTNTKRQLCAS